MELFRFFALILFQYVMYIPGLAILLKIPLVMPGLSGHLENIRGGWERNSASKNNILQTKFREPFKNTNYTIAMPDGQKSSGRIISVI